MFTDCDRQNYCSFYQNRRKTIIILVRYTHIAHQKHQNLLVKTVNHPRTQQTNWHVKEVLKYPKFIYKKQTIGSILLHTPINIEIA